MTLIPITYIGFIKRSVSVFGSSVCIVFHFCESVNIYISILGGVAVHYIFKFYKKYNLLKIN